MATRTSILVRTAAALCAVTAGGLALTAVDPGAHASATAQADAIPAPFASTVSQTPGSPAATAPGKPSGQPEAVPAKPAEPVPTAVPATGSAVPVPAPPAPAKPAAPAAAPVAAPAPLAPAKLPDAGASWKPIAQPHTQPVVHDVGLNECAAVKGAVSWQQQGYVSSFKTPAIQDTFTFADPAAAQRAYTDVLTAMNSCQQHSRDAQSAAKLTPDAVVNATANVAGGAAYARQWNAVAGMSAPGPQTGHVYVVQRGGVLAVLQFAVPAGAPGDHILSAADDRSALAALAAHLESAPTAS